MGFLEKLSTDDTMPGLHIEPIQQSADPRIRTGRVNDNLRAVLFKLTGEGDPHYLFHGVWPHDEAIDKAKTLTLSVNPINGQATIRDIADIRATTGQPPEETQLRTAASWLAGQGYYTEGLTRQLGLPEEVADRAMAVTTPEALATLSDQEEGWIADVLLELAVGTPLSQIVENLDLIATQPSQADGDADVQIIQALQTPTAKAQFAFVGNQDELRHVIEDGDFGQWRLFLHPEQRRYATQTSGGPFKLTGAAGTGKTVVLVHRAKYLADANSDARIVVTTYTRNLADSLRETIADLDRTIPLVRLGESGVCVFGVDALIAATIKQAGDDIANATASVLGYPRSDMQSRTNEKAWTQAIDLALSWLPPEIANEPFFQAEYATVILPSRITTLDEYLRVRRPGRGVALSRDKRKAVWDVIANYRSQSRVLGTVDYPEAAAIAAAWLENRQGQPFADHVLIDEGQDLSATQWQFLRALVLQGPDDLFIAEDVHQRIYGQRIVLGRYGIKVVGRSRRLTLNYRTTAQNLRAAMATLQGGDYRDMEDDTQSVQITGYRSARTGPDPITITVANRNQEAEAVATQIQRWLNSDPNTAPETIAVLVHDRHSREHMAEDLAGHGIAIRSVDRERPQPGKPLVMTMHRAKGLEFSKVIIIAHGAWPTYYKDATRNWDDTLKEDADLRERSLTYVAMTRARDELVIIDRPR